MIRIGVDIDDTSIDLVPAWLALHNERTGDSLSMDQIKSWGVHQYTPFGAQVYETLEVAGLYERVEAIPGAAKGLRNLRERYRIVFITANALPSLKEKVSCLVRHGLLAKAAANDNVAVMHDKALARVDLLIDDKPGNIESFPGPAILFDRPWNQSWKTPETHQHPVVRCTSWEAIPSFVDVLLEYNRLCPQ